MWTILFIAFVWFLFFVYALLSGNFWFVLGSLGLLLLLIHDFNHHKPTDNNDQTSNNNSSDYADDGESYSPNNRPTISYSNEDDTYDGFYKQREEEYRQEYGDDFEDAIDDEWENRKRR